MLKRLIATATALIALASFGSVADAATKSKLYLSFQAGTPNLFVAELVSNKEACADGRKVTIYKVQTGKDKRVGADRSFAGKGDSYVAIIKSASADPGKYYAKVKGTDDCEAAKSKKLTI